MNFHQIYFLLRNLINTGPVFSCLSYSRIDKRDPIQLLANCSKILQSSSNTAATKIITNKAICLKVRHFLSKKFLCFPSNLILDYPASPSFFILYSVTQIPTRFSKLYLSFVFPSNFRALILWMLSSLIYSTYPTSFNKNEVFKTCFKS